MKKVVMAAIVIVSVLLISNQGYAVDAASAGAAAEKLLNLFNMDENYDQAMNQAKQMSMNLIDSQNLPENEKKKAREAIEASMKITLDKFSWSKMKSIFVEIYAEVLTLEELQGLIDFYESPIGQKFIKKQPQLTAATMQKMQDVMQEIMPEIQKQVEESVKDIKSNKMDACDGQ